LQDAAANFDPFGQHRRRGHGADRIGPEGPSPNGVEKPQAIKSSLLRKGQAGGIITGGGRRAVKGEADAKSHIIHPAKY
jgi:hypothetical protein